MMRWTCWVVAGMVPLLLLVDQTCGQRAAQGTINRVVQLGNPLKASISGLDTLPEPGAIFLMHDVILSDGVVFAFSAFFRSDAPVRLQIWRPVSKNTLNNATSQAFTLLFELKVTPSVVNRREDVYIESRIVKKCIRVRHGDRLGVHLEKSPSAVAYAFDKNQPAALGYTYKKDDAVTKVKETVNFDLLKFPYDFSLAAYIDTDLRGYSDKTEQPCPLGLLIPAHLRPALPTVAAPTAPPQNAIMGATGERGVGGIMGGRGPKGPHGYPGYPGIPGPRGLKGPGGTNGALGPGGSPGDPGDEGVGGLPGVKGPPGYSGEMGPVGPPGPAGINGVLPDPGENDIAISAASTQGPDRLKVIIITVWLIVVSLIILIVVVLLIVVKRRDRYAYMERLPSAGPDFKPSWMDVLAESEVEESDNARKQPKTPEVIPDNLPTYEFDNPAMSYGY